MTKKEFTKLFKVGDKINRSNHVDNRWFVEIKGFGNYDEFCGVDVNGIAVIRRYNSHSLGKWLPYKEPALTWNWEAPFMWGKGISGKIFLFDKLGTVSYRGVLLSDEYTNITKKDIIRNCTPTTQPDNWKEYGLTEEDLNG